MMFRSFGSSLVPVGWSYFPSPFSDCSYACLLFNTLDDRPHVHMYSRISAFAHRHRGMSEKSFVLTQANRLLPLTRDSSNGLGHLCATCDLLEVVMSV